MSTNYLSTLVSKFYSSASNARRAAKAAGVADYTLTTGEQGVAYVPSTPVPTTNTTGDQLGGEHTADLPTWAVAPTITLAEPTPAATVPGHKHFARYAPSAILKPVGAVHAYLNDYGADMTRKEALYNLSQLGINYSTARTQYQVWFQANK